MKRIILFFVLYVHYSMSQSPGQMRKSINVYPKKVRPSMIQYNNAGKYIKSAPVVEEKKRSKDNKGYTAFSKPFPTLDEIKPPQQIVPDSPYFPIDQPSQPETRSRVKKVLEDYPLTRQKRSAASVDKERKVKGKRRPSASRNVQVENEKGKLPLKSKNTHTVLKKSKSSAKRKEGKIDKLRSAKKRRQVKHSDKKVAREQAQTPVKKTRGHRNKNHPEDNKRISQILKQPHHGRPQSLKLSNKRPTKSEGGLKRLKGDRSERLISGTKPQKKVAQAHGNITKLRGASNPKGRSARRLIAGRDALIEDYPYTISIQKDGTHWCSGAILNPRLIITTANCLWRSQTMSRLRVRVGSRHTDRGGQLAKIQEVMKHPLWKLRKNPDNDVALALLDRNIKFSHGVHGVDLPNRVMMPPFDDVWVTSWGAERRDGIFDTRSVNLQVYHARLINREKCNNVTQRFAVTVSENFICLSQSGQRGPCTRDTGAPAVSDGVLWGLASWGIRKLCGTERFPSMFSYTGSPSNMHFIINATHYLMSDERHYPFLDRYPLMKLTHTTPTLMTLPFDL